MNYTVQFSACTVSAAEVKISELKWEKNIQKKTAFKSFN